MAIRAIDPTQQVQVRFESLLLKMDKHTEKLIELRDMMKTLLRMREIEYHEADFGALAPNSCPKDECKQMKLKELKVFDKMRVRGKDISIKPFDAMSMTDSVKRDETEVDSGLSGPNSCHMIEHKQESENEPEVFDEILVRENCSGKKYVAAMAEFVKRDEIRVDSGHLRQSWCDRFEVERMEKKEATGVVHLSLKEAIFYQAPRMLDEMLVVSFEPDSNVEFLTQVSMVSILKRENLVGLHSHCVDGNTRVLAYGYAMTSLHDILHGPVFNWIKCSNEGTYGGVSLNHKYGLLCIPFDSGGDKLNHKPGLLCTLFDPGGKRADKYMSWLVSPFSFEKLNANYSMVLIFLKKISRYKACQLSRFTTKHTNQTIGYMLHLMKDSWVYPSVVTYNVYITGLCKCEKFSEVLELLKMMRKSELKMDLYMYNALIDSPCELGTLVQRECEAGKDNMKMYVVILQNEKSKNKKKLESNVLGSSDIELITTLMETREFKEIREYVDGVNFTLDRLKKGQQGKGLVKQLVMVVKHEKITIVIKLFANECTYSLPADHREEGLVELTAAARELTSEVAQQLDHIVPSVLNSFGDQNSRVRYYTCQALYNIARVRSGNFMVLSNHVFEELCRLLETTYANVQSAARLLDRLVKDIVTESDQFGIKRFIPLFSWKNIMNSFVRQLVEIKNSPSVDYGRMADILVRRVSSLDEFTPLTAISWDGFNLSKSLPTQKVDKELLIMVFFGAKNLDCYAFYLIQGEINHTLVCHVIVNWLENHMCPGLRVLM